MIKIEMVIFVVAFFITWGLANFSNDSKKTVNILGL